MSIMHEVKIGFEKIQSAEYDFYSPNFARRTAKGDRRCISNERVNENYWLSDHLYPKSRKTLK